MLTSYNLLVVTGATAGGKTQVATNLAIKINAEIISADSRQVYKGMDIGTGKDLEDYTINSIKIPYHLIDIVEAGYKYNVFEFRRDFFNSFIDISNRNKTAILCGGTGLYIESLIKNYELVEVPVNESLRKELEGKTIQELEIILKSFKEIHNRSDLDTTKRAIRAIEIADYYSKNPKISLETPKINALVTAINYDRDQRRERITERLRYRLENGMIAEAEKLIKNGVSHNDLEYYGLEYKYLSWYLAGKVNYNQLFEGLNTAIHQFAKRQMTWFRKMEKNGIKIHWIDGNKSLEEKSNEIISLWYGQ